MVDGIQSYSNLNSAGQYGIHPVSGDIKHYITDHSDSDLSVFEVQSLGSTKGLKVSRGPKGGAGGGGLL